MGIGFCIHQTGESIAGITSDALTLFAVLLVETDPDGKWEGFMATFFDETHARSIGLNTELLKIVFFAILAACTVAALQTVGAFLVIAMVVTPGATAYLLTDHFPRLSIISVIIGAITSFFGAYFSFFLDGATGGIIVCFQTLIFLAAFFFAPKQFSSRCSIVVARQC